MDFDVLADFIDLIATVFTWIVIASALLSFFLSPYHPVREALERIVGPFLNPIRRLMSSTGGIDFSPVILILIVRLFQWILTSILRN